MKCFVTGITGFIGSNLARELVMDGHSVNAIIRNPSRPGLKRIEGVQYFNGDLQDREILKGAMSGCEVVFHLAAFAKPWAKDPGTYHRINVEGAGNVFAAAKEAGARRVVFTSTGATMAPSSGLEPVNESTVRNMPFLTLYEETKAEAERLARDFCSSDFSVVVVNPTRVYGPGPLNPSNAATKMIIDYNRGKWKIIPGDGQKAGNYVYIDDVIHGHILAASNGRPGERYILGGENLTFDDFFMIVKKVSGQHYRMYHLPLPVMLAASRIMEAGASVTGIPPLITAAFVKKYLRHWSVSSEKAVSELGYQITPFHEGVKMTLEWAEREFSKNC